MKKFVNMKAVVLSFLMFAFSSCIFALEPIMYLDENGDTQYVENYKFLTGEETTLSRGWYVVKGDIELKTPNWTEIEVRGNVHLIMMDNSVCKIKGSGGFDGMESGSTMSIYTQSHGENEGKMYFDVEDLFCFYMWEMKIFGGSFFLDGCKDQCAGIYANEIVLKNCTINIDACNAFWATTLTTDGVDMTIKTREKAFSINEWVVKNTTGTSTINITCRDKNRIETAVELPEGMVMTIGEETYVGTIPAEVIQESMEMSVGAGSGNMTSVECLPQVENALLSRDAWFTLDGVRLSGKPTDKGMYVHNGKKIIVK